MSNNRARWSRLTFWQRQLLRKAGLVRNPQETKAQTNLAELEVIYEKQGNIEGLVIRLSHFVLLLRQLQQEGKLDAETKARCDRICFVWETYTHRAQEIYWNKRYAQAQAYVKQFPDVVPAPHEWKDKGIGQVGGFSNEPLEYHDTRTSRASEEDPGLEKHRIEWENRYKQALALYQKLGPYRGKVYKDEDRLLKRWIARQKLIWDDLNPSQQERLLAIGLEKNDGKIRNLRRIRNVLKVHLNPKYHNINQL